MSQDVKYLQTFPFMPFILMKSSCYFFKNLEAINLLPSFFTVITIHLTILNDT